MHMFHSSCLQVLSFDYEVINWLNNVLWKEKFHYYVLFTYFSLKSTHVDILLYVHWPGVKQSSFDLGNRQY